MLYPSDEEYERVGREKYAQIAEQETGAVETRLRRKDGRVIDVLLSSTPLDPTDLLAGVTFTALDITEHKRAENLLRAQRDLALQLGVTVGLDETLRLCVEAAIHNTEMDAGGVYLVDETSGNLDLRYSTGLSPDFIALTSHYDADAPNTRLVMEGRPIYINYQELDVPMDEIRRNEGLGGIAILPILHEGQVIACLNIASHSLFEIPAATCDTLETIAGQIGSAIAHSKAQEALQQSEKRLRRVVENMPVMMDALDEDSNIIVWNRECERVTGYSAAEIEGNLQSLEMLYPDAAYREQMVAEVVGLGLNYRNKEWTLTCKDGAKKTISWSSVSSQFPIPGWYSWAIGVDVTARKQAEEERERLLVQIQEQARRMQQIMDTVPEGVLLLKADGQVILTNPVAGRHLDILAGARPGDTLTHLGNRPLAEFLTSPPKGLWHEITMGDRVFELIARPMENSHELEDWVMVINDVTQQREIQQHIQHQERLASVGQLAAGIAHDFNNIMATIVLYAQMTARMEKLPTVIRERMETINQQAGHASKLIQQILDFSRRAVLNRQPVDLALLLKEHVRLLKRTLPESVEIKLTYGLGKQAAPLAVHADPTRMQQMVTNLSVNARDAMPNGGTLRIGLERIEVKPRESPLLPEMEPGEWVQVTISDTGTGIPPDVLPHIFEPFFTTKAPLGSGLGLSQVHGIVGQHGGRIDVESHVGQGTTFTIYLPALLESPLKLSSVSELEESLTLPTGKGEIVLVVEDNAIVRKALVESLELLNYRTREATNGQEALAMLEQHGDDIDLLLSDMVMPGMGGVALLHALRERGLTVKAVMITGHLLEKELDELRAQGMADWLHKPPELEKLAEVVARVLGMD